MREYLFRAKLKGNKRHYFEEDTDGLWVEGNILQLPDGSCQIVTLSKFHDAFERFNVDPETVGQYIGLSDRHGKMIFEGDIVLTQTYYDRANYSEHRKGSRRIGVVKYSLSYADDSKTPNEAMWSVELKDDKTHSKYIYGSWGDFYDCEITGNIYDNPELLEGGRIA